MKFASLLTIFLCFFSFSSFAGERIVEEESFSKREIRIGLDIVDGDKLMHFAGSRYLVPIELKSEIVGSSMKLMTEYVRIFDILKSNKEGIQSHHVLCQARAKNKYRKVMNGGLLLDSIVLSALGNCRFVKVDFTGSILDQRENSLSIDFKTLALFEKGQKDLEE